MRKRVKTPARRPRLSASLIAVLASCVFTLSAPSATKPKLYLSITVEGLDANTLQLLRDAFGPGGFNRLLTTGLAVESLDYGGSGMIGVDPVAAAAILQTGAYAGVNGIAGETVATGPRLIPAPALLDEGSLGNFTSVTLSPKNLAASTLADELRIADSGKSRVWALGADPQQAIIQAGHAGNAAFWIDDATGRWASTTYYREQLRHLTEANYNRPLTARLDTMRWEPLAASTALAPIPDSKKRYTFSYTFPAKDAERIARYKASPKVNTEITDAAIAQVVAAAADRSDGATDMLGVSYNLSPFPYSRSGDQRHEIYDAYIRLDADIARLLKAVDSASGPGGSVVTVAGLPPSTGLRRDDEMWRIPGGTFSPKKAVGLLNMYFMAIHGNGEWVRGYHDRRFMLNRALIKEKGLDLSAMRAEAAAFLEKMSGVRRAHTLDYLLLMPETAALLTPGAESDVFIEIMPGWEVEYTQGASGGRNSGVERPSAGASLPFLLVAPGVAPRRLEGKLDARRVAPTVARVLRIRSPGAATEPPEL